MACVGLPEPTKQSAHSRPSRPRKDHQMVVDNEFDDSIDSCPEPLCVLVRARLNVPPQSCSLSYARTTGVGDLVPADVQAWCAECGIERHPETGEAWRRGWDGEPLCEECTKGRVWIGELESFHAGTCQLRHHQAFFDAQEHELEEDLFLALKEFYIEYNAVLEHRLAGMSRAVSEYGWAETMAVFLRYFHELDEQAPGNCANELTVTIDRLRQAQQRLMQSEARALHTEQQRDDLDQKYRGLRTWITRHAGTCSDAGIHAAPPPIF